MEFCEHCVFGKQKRVSFSTGVYRTKGTIDYMHSDLWGLSRIPSKGEHRYMLTIINDFSRKVWTYFLKQKNKVFSTFKKWKIVIENQNGKRVKRLRTNNGSEFCEGDFKLFCENEGIARHHTVVGTPQQNGIAERINRTIMERVLCMLSNSGLPKEFWAEAASTAYYLVNRSPHTSLQFRTPKEVWSDYSNLKVFACPAYAHVNQGKLEPRARKCIFLGYSVGVKGYRLWCPNLKKVIISGDVTFNKSALLHPKKEVADSSSSHTSDVLENATEKVEFGVSNASQ